MNEQPPRKYTMQSEPGRPVSQPAPAAAPRPVTTARPVATAHPVAHEAPPSYERPAAPPKAPVYERPVAPPPVSPESFPPEYQPLSPWAYWGLSILFAVPIVGFVFLIVFSISRGNIHRRNFARSYWCSLILAVIIIIILAATGVGADLLYDIF